jgi:uncharacterized membrane protein YhiD involved in acid resistance
MNTNSKEFINAAIIGCSTAIIVYEAGEKICNWFDRRRRKRKIIENIKDKEEEFNNFVEEIKEEKINLKDLDKYSDEKLKRIFELTYYFKIYKNLNDIIDILERSLQEKGEK